MDVADRIVARCACGAKIAVPSSAAGRRAKCPKCGEAIQIPQAETPPESLSAGDDLLGDLAKAEESGSAVGAGGPRTRPCPNCSAAMSFDAVVCVSCGYNTSTGRSAKLARTKPTTTEKAAGLAGKAALFAGNLVLGCVCSLIGALIGAALWAGVAIGTDVESGYIAWALGGLAGIGMAIGYRRSDPLGGICAAGASLVGIAAARLAIVAYLISHAVSGAAPAANANVPSADSMERMELVSMLTTEVLHGQEEDEDVPETPEWRKAHDAATARVDKMTTEEVHKAMDRQVVLQTLVEKVHEEHPEVSDPQKEQEIKWFDEAVKRVNNLPPTEISKRAAAVKEEQAKAVAQATKEVLTSGTFWAAIFFMNRLSILFIGLAVVTAYSVAVKFAPVSG